MKRKKGLTYIFLLVGTILISMFFILCFVLFSWIAYELFHQCNKAQKMYTGDCVQSLTALLDDDSQDFRSRNEAIWALGQFRDKRAYPTLKKYYTGNIPPREPLDKSLSQYELKKAINLTDNK